MDSYRSDFSGMRTDPEVKMLMDKFGTPNVGEEIQYSEIAVAIMCDVRSSRWKSVTDAWRRCLERDPHNVVLICQDKRKFVVASNSDRIYLARKKQKSGAKAIMRGSNLAVRTNNDGLSDEERKMKDHATMLTAKLRLAELTAPKDA